MQPSSRKTKDGLQTSDFKIHTSDLQSLNAGFLIFFFLLQTQFRLAVFKFLQQICFGTL